MPADYVARLDFNQIFGRHAPIEIDLGCGDGAYLAAIATAAPARNFLGIERLLGRVRSTCRKVAASGLSNARVLRIESLYAVRDLFPHRSIDAFHIMFPDPWPKRRHQRRRLLDEPFFDALALALTARGIVQVATDQREYFDLVRESATASGAFREIDWCSRAQTTFERHFCSRGLPVYRLALSKEAPER